MLKEPISKKQKMNVITHVIAYQWVLSLLSEDKIKNIDSSEVFKQLPTEPYFFSQGQVRINSFTLKLFKKKIKKVLSSNKKKIMNVTLSEVLDA